MNQRSSSFYRLILTGICWVAVVNFLALWTVSFVFGDAWFGYVEDGRFCLAKGASHRQPLLVTPGVFALSLWHVKSQFVTVPLAILAAWLLRRTQRRHGQ